MRRLTSRIVALSLVAGALSAIGPQRSPVGAAPSAVDTANTFTEFAAGGFYSYATAAEWLPGDTERRLIVTELDGTVNLANTTTGQSTELFQLPDVALIDATAALPDGLLDVAVDPGYATNRWFYLYSIERDTRRPRVDRFTMRASGDLTYTTRTTIWQAPGAILNTPNHLGGSLTVGPDGALYIGIGFGSGEADVEQYPQQRDNIYGKILRINRDGSVPADNPFNDGDGSNIDEIWAYGLRQPFRGDWDGNDYWVGDVGGDTSGSYEEANVIVRGGNYGYPDCEGALGVCPTGTIAAKVTYKHPAAVPQCCFNRAIVGGTVYRGSGPTQHFPTSFNGTYIYTDYTRDGRFYWWTPGQPGEKLLIDTPEHNIPIWVDQSPHDGMLYWLEFGSRNDGSVRRLRYATPGNRPPRIDTVIEALPLAGAAPHNVTFRIGDLAYDPDGTPLTYRWDFGDGSSATTKDVRHTYTRGGFYVAQLTVTSGGMSTRSQPVRISVGNPPTATITSPVNGTQFSAGDTISLTGTAKNPNGTSLAASAMKWRVEFSRGGVLSAAFSGTGPTLDFTVPTTGRSWEGDTRYVVTFSATNSVGVTTTDIVNLLPRKRTLSISSPTATTVVLDGVTRGLPLSFGSLVGFRHRLEAPATMCANNARWRFAGWSDGGAATRTYTVLNGTNALQTLYDSDGATCGLYAVASPLRVLDTRSRRQTFDGRERGTGRLEPGVTRELPIAGRSSSLGSIPAAADVAAVSLNVTVVGATEIGFLTAWPCGQPMPRTATLNFAPGAVVNNATVVKLGSGGRVCLSASAAVDVIVDFSAYVTDGSELFFTSAPRRIHDTRATGRTDDGRERATGRLSANRTKTILVRGRFTVPTNADSVLLNVAAIRPDSNGFLTVWACDQPRPNAANINVVTGVTRAGFVIARPSAAGTVCVYSSTGVDLAVDISGWFADRDLFVGLPTPARLVDTRRGQKTADGLQAGQGVLIAGRVSVIRVGGRVGLPGAVRSVMLNVVAVRPTAGLFITVFPCGSKLPGTSTVNAAAGETTANAVWSRVGPDGTVCAVASGRTDLIVDIAGYFVG